MANIIKWCNQNQGFLSAILSIVAVGIAVGVPVYIAKRQDRIALFEKRYVVFVGLLECINYLRKLTGELYSYKDTNSAKSIIKKNILRREGNMITCTEQVEEFSDSSCLEYFIKRSIMDVNNIQQVVLIFDINSNNRSLLLELIVAYWKIKPQICELLQNNHEGVFIRDIDKLTLQDDLSRGEKALTGELIGQLKLTKHTRVITPMPFIEANYENHIP